MSFKSLLDESDDIIYITDIETYEILYMNKAAQDLLHLTRNQYRHKKCYKYIQNQDSPCPFCTNHLLTFDKFYVWDFYNSYIKRHYMLKDKLITWEGRTARYEIGVDISEKENKRFEIERNLKIEETLISCIRMLSENDQLSDAIDEILKLTGEFYNADRAYLFEFDIDKQVACNTYEWTSKDSLALMNTMQNLNLQDLQILLQHMREKGSLVIDSIDTLLGKDTKEYKLLSAQNIVNLIILPIMDNDGTISGCIGVDNPKYAISDTSLLHSLSYFIKIDLDKRSTNKLLYKLSYTDSLTGLYNRHKYMSFLYDTDTEQLSSVGVVYIDLNRLKQANDTYGHAYGDKILINTAQILRSIFHENTYRIGGDEFVAFCLNIRQQDFLNKVQCLRSRFDEMSNISISIGHTWKDDVIDLLHMIKYADELMYIDKQTQQHNFSIASHHDTQTLQSLLKALKKEEFIIYLQPKISIQNEKLAGAEALIRHRVNHEIEGPSAFIPFLEQERLIRHIDFYALEQVCRLLHNWIEKGYPLYPISVNFSRITLMEDRVVETMKAICERYHVPVALIDIEITESVSKMDMETIITVSEKLNKAGFSLSLDDFGARYSNLALLTMISFRSLKLDKSLIDHIATNDKSRLIARHSIEVCKDLDNTHSIAEGVENEEQLKILKELGCDQIQGFYYSRPLDIASFEAKYQKKLIN